MSNYEAGVTVTLSRPMNVPSVIVPYFNVFDYYSSIFGLSILSLRTL